MPENLNSLAAKLPPVLQPYWSALDQGNLDIDDIPALNDTTVSRVAVHHLRAALYCDEGALDAATVELQQAVDLADEHGIDDTNLRKKICVIYTNCHGLGVGVMLNAIPEFRASYTAVRVRHAGAYRDMDAGDFNTNLARLIERADIFLYQVGLFGMERIQPYLSILPASAKVISIPFVTLTTLWPNFFHATEWDEDGVKKRLYPYGDAYIRDLKARGLDIEAIASRYSSEQFGGPNNLDRAFQIEAAKTRMLEDKTDIKIRDFIDDNFRDRCLFRTPLHPTRDLLSHMAKQVAEKLGLPASSEEAFLNVKDVLPKDELPIHPVVALHFKLNYLNPNGLFKVRALGKLSFNEFVHAYASDKIMEPSER